MIECLVLSKTEILLLVVALSLLLLYHLKSGYEWRKAIVWTLVLVPILYFSINMVTEAVTVDEPGYEVCITDVRNIKGQGKAFAVLYEYKLAQLIEGTIFLLIPTYLKGVLGLAGIWMLYKIIHWLLIFFASLIITNVWRKYILTDKDERRNRITENAIFAVLIGLPVSCLLIKVTNYDAGSTYPAILGLSLIWVAYKNQSNKFVYAGPLITALGVLDKWTALPYWIISVVLASSVACETKLNFKEKALEIAKITIISICSAIFVSVIYFLYTNFQQDGFFQSIDAGVVVFSFVHAIKGVATGDLTVNSSNSDVLLLIPLAFIILSVTIILELVKTRIAKSKEQITAIYLRTDLSLMMLGILGGDCLKTNKFTSLK